MSEIVKNLPSAHEKNVLQTLAGHYQDLVSLRLEKPFFRYEEREQRYFCLDIITKSFNEAGDKGSQEKQVLHFQTGFLLEELKNKVFSQLTVSEIKFAFYEGIRGQYGPYFGMCPKTYHQFLKHFIENKDRSEAWNRYLDGIDKLRFSETPKVLTPEYLAQVAKNAFRDYKESGALPPVPHAIYNEIKNFLGVKSLIETKEWQSVQDEAKTNLEKRHKSRKGDKSVSEILNMESRTWEFEIKRIGLKRYFDKLITEGKTLEL